MTEYDPNPPIDLWGDGLGRASTALRANATAASFEAAVPTCPGWTVADVVAHQSMVHRWATAVLRGQSFDQIDAEALEVQARESGDPLGWFDDGATGLLQAIVDLPDDAEVPFIWDSGDSGKRSWTRRQCHETTIHAIDAMSARLGRAPDAADTWIRTELAVDGIDEILRGFGARPGKRFTVEQVVSFVVSPTDATTRWLVTLRPGEPAQVDLDPSSLPEQTDAMTGTATDLYLRLWNRSAAEPTGAGERAWREAMKIRWS